MIEVLDSGPLLTVQDNGRPGYAHLGVPPSGAADARAAAAANAAVGNAAGAAVLEATLAGPRLRFLEPAVVAVAGAVVRGPSSLGAGEELDLGRYERGARAYVAVRGGIDVDPVLGSRSTDLMSGLGPPAVRSGDILPVGSGTALETASLAYDLPNEPVLRLLPGPRADWVDASALGTASWRVSPASNRVGIRLEGPTLPFLRDDELESEGVVTGAIQVPRGGQPILLGPDHPTTGGYPVAAVVHSEDFWLTGQLRPGDTVGFRLTPEPGSNLVRTRFEPGS
jgi:biotin-dependent carboxylase-like uncharacterized protein